MDLTRKSFIGTLAGGVAALLNLPKKANAILPPAQPVQKVRAENPFPTHRNNVGDPPDHIGINGDTWNDRWTGKFWKKFDGKYIHIATAISDGRKDRA